MGGMEHIKLCLVANMLLAWVTCLSVHHCKYVPCLHSAQVHVDSFTLCQTDVVDVHSGVFWQLFDLHYPECDMMFNSLPVAAEAHKRKITML